MPTARPRRPGRRLAAPVLAALLVVSCATSTPGSATAGDGAPPTAERSATGDAPAPTGTVVFAHDVAGAPELSLRVSTEPLPENWILDFGAFRATLEQGTTDTPFLEYGQEHTVPRAPGTYAVGMVDRDGNQVGALRPESVSADGTLPTGAGWLIMAQSFPMDPALAPSGSPPAGSPAAAIEEAALVLVQNDVLDSAPVRFWITAPAGATAAQRTALGADGLVSPALGYDEGYVAPAFPLGGWFALLPPGTYTITAWEGDRPVAGEAPLTFEDGEEGAGYFLTEMPTPPRGPVTTGPPPR